ncbi:MAG: lectin like domain-containing protein [Thermodesulfobacteriota bacterium]
MTLTYGSLESYLMPAEVTDFSEQHLIDQHGFDRGPCEGGNLYMSAAYLLRWDGPMDESDFPYLYQSFSSSLPKKHVQNILMLPPKTSDLDNDAIKEAIMRYGAVYTAYYHSNSYYNATYRSYYYNGTNSANHAVAIVGWDDDFDRNRFNTSAPGNGAFIYRNSWGTSWGDGGYGYVSYYDTRFARDEKGNAVIKVEDTTNYAQVYQYDPLGWVSSYYSCGEGCGWGANIYTAEYNQVIQAVGFYALSANTSYQVYIYTGVANDQPTSGTLKSTKNGTINLPGFYTISLADKVSVNQGQQFSVVLYVNSPGYKWPVAMEKKYSGYSSNASAERGQGFLSGNGSTWTDMLNVWPDHLPSVCLKVYANPAPVISGTVYDAGGQPLTGESVRIEVYSQDPCNNQQILAWADTNVTNGAYTVTGLQDLGPYYVQAGRLSRFYDEWFGANGSDCSKASPVWLNTDLVNFTMIPFLLGDINGDRVVDLSDIVIGLKTCAGSATIPNPKGDVNGDQQIGMPEVIYQMQHVGGMQ